METGRRLLDVKRFGRKAAESFEGHIRKKVPCGSPKGMDVDGALT
jgi:hypothetical protein